LIALADGAPTLQPASMLTASDESSSREPRGRQDVGGVTADSGAEPAPSADDSRETESPVPANAGAVGADGSSSTTFPLVIAAILAGLAALALVTLRRRAVATQAGGRAGTSTFTPPAEPQTVPAGPAAGASAEPTAGALAEPAAGASAEPPAGASAEASTPEPAAAAGSTSRTAVTDAPRVTEVRRVPQNSGQRIARSASSAAMSAASLALRELKRRRGRD
jgi:hypothetical protein